MIVLHGHSRSRWDDNGFVARVTTDPDRPCILRPDEVLVLKDRPALDTRDFRALLRCQSMSDLPFDCKAGTIRVIDLPETLSHLRDGDVIQFEPKTGRLEVLYRRDSNSNTILFTEECNNYCMMCSQPPVNHSRYCTLSVWRQAIPLISKDTVEMGISGGEPTLYPVELLELIRLCRNYLSTTALHVLSNGRFFSYLKYCEDLASLQHPDLMIGIPIYSDLDYHHDFIVQTQGAFEQTVRGVLNLARVGVKVEIRIVLLKQNINRLEGLANFIARNFPFAKHVALMGLEPIGLARANQGKVWIDPFDYKDVLRSAARYLSQMGMNISIYNHQLCILDESIRYLARQSISDWKLEYLDACQECCLRDKCCGFFASGTKMHSAHIRALRDSPSTKAMRAADA